MHGLLHSILTSYLAFESATESRNEFHIAPMQCYTNAPLRKLCHILSPSSIQWTEMEKVDDLYPKKEQHPENYLFHALEKRLRRPEDYDEESHLVLQLGSNDPYRMEACVYHTLQHYNFREININCGCPSIESGGAATYGASLMKDAALTSRLVSSIEKAVGANADSTTRPDLSVKCRIGVFDHFEDMRPLHDGDYELLKNYVGAIRDAGANHVVLHARPAILSGLSPLKNRKSGIVPLDYPFAEQIATDFPDMKVTLNGGIKSFSQLESFQKRGRTKTNITSHMAGRWVLRRPLDLIGVESLLQGGGQQDSYGRSATVAIEEYTNYAIAMGNSRSFTTAELCLPLYLIAEQLRDDYNHEYDENDDDDDDDGDGITAAADGEGDTSKVTHEPEALLLNDEEIEHLHDVIQNSVKQMEECSGSGSGGRKKKKKRNSRDHDDGSSSSFNLKRLSSSFKSLVGTKVANKWKRNRSEL